MAVASTVYFISDEILGCQIEGIDMSIVKVRQEAPTVALVPPDTGGYLLLAGTVEGRRPFLPSRRRRALIAALKPKVAELARQRGVRQADLFRAQLFPPGMGVELLKKRAARVTPARFDVVVLIHTDSPDEARALQRTAVYDAVRSELTTTSRHTHEILAHNVRRIADVDHTRPSVFLFNFFYADDNADLLPVWEHTARWFVDNTDLPDSVVLEPLTGESDAYGIVNHASWPSYRTFLPHFILRPSFRRFVLATFAANNIAAQPILYRRESV
jgi:hypothetical protein